MVNRTGRKPPWGKPTTPPFLSRDCHIQNKKRRREEGSEKRDSDERREDGEAYREKSEEKIREKREGT